MESLDEAGKQWSDWVVDDLPSIWHKDTHFPTQFASDTGYLGKMGSCILEMTMKFPSQEPYMAPTFSSVTSLSSTDMVSSVSYGPPQKMIKLNSSDGIAMKQFNENGSLAGIPHVVQGFQNFVLHPQNELSDAELDGFFASLSSLPRVRDEAYGMKLESPSTLVDMGVTPVSQRSQESPIADVHASETVPRTEIPLSSTVSFDSGKRLSDHILTRGVDVTLPNISSKGICSYKRIKDHVIAERKRREMLNERLAALSAVIPGLKKLDKASVLADAIKYVKHLEERVKELEEQTLKGKSTPTHSSKPLRKLNGKVTDSSEVTSLVDIHHPDIAVHLMGNNVLIKIHCAKRKGILVKILAELEKLQLELETANILSFSETTLDLTLGAQMEKACELTSDGIANTLQGFFGKME